MSTAKRPRPARERRKRAGLKAELPTIASLDKRTRSAQIVIALRDEILSDLGGSDRVSAGQRQIVDRAAMLGAILEAAEVRFLKGEPFDPGSYATLAAVQARLFKVIGLRRQPRDVTPDLKTYLASKAAPADQAAAA